MHKGNKIPFIGVLQNKLQLESPHLFPICSLVHGYLSTHFRPEDFKDCLDLIEEKAPKNKIMRKSFLRIIY